MKYIVIILLLASCSKSKLESCGKITQRHIEHTDKDRYFVTINTGTATVTGEVSKDQYANTFVGNQYCVTPKF